MEGSTHSTATVSFQLKKMTVSWIDIPVYFHDIPHKRALNIAIFFSILAGWWFGT
jgi:hypothetical protein